MKKLQRGATIVEMIVVLAIIGILYGVGSYGWQLLQSSKATGDTKLMDIAMECARTTYTNESNYSAATIVSLANNNCFPDSLVTNKGTTTASVSNKYGSAISAIPVNLYGVSDGLEFSESGVPSNVCIERLKGVTRPVIVKVTPAAGAEVVVMALGANRPNMTLATACGVGTTAMIKQTISKN